ncbi:hypothetical protein [Streptomyces sp. NPDC002553]|uniref:hypothetical protein n=1 Tax=Streptomyces sp. NPDC002553 TaxID=3154417 RepID=UPI0033248263
MRSSAARRYVKTGSSWSPAGCRGTPLPTSWRMTVRTPKLQQFVGMGYTVVVRP